MVSLRVIKGLYANSGGSCAYPNCSAELYDTEHGSVVSEIAHIRSEKKEGPRYDPNYPVEQIDSYDNLIIFCLKHHKIVDDHTDQYPAVILEQWKRDHEHSVTPIEIDEKIFTQLIQEWRLVINITDESESNVVVSNNQLGGQTAQTITNIHTSNQIDNDPVEEDINSNNLCKRLGKWIVLNTYGSLTTDISRLLQYSVVISILLIIIPLILLLGPFLISSTPNYPQYATLLIGISLVVGLFMLNCIEKRPTKCPQCNANFAFYPYKKIIYQKEYLNENLDREKSSIIKKCENCGYEEIGNKQYRDIPLSS